MKTEQPIDYCPQCGAYHEIYGSCDSDQTEPDTDICPICLDEKSVDDLHRNCGK